MFRKRSYTIRLKRIVFIAIFTSAEGIMLISRFVARFVSQLDYWIICDDIFERGRWITNGGLYFGGNLESGSNFRFRD